MPSNAGLGWKAFNLRYPRESTFGRVRPQERAGLRLPTAEPVRIDEEKVRGYLLSPTHPVGRFKARVFARLGFEEQLRKYTVQVS
jgi:hypothetical protein